MARIIGHTATKVRIELRLNVEEWARFRSRYDSEAFALRDIRLLFEDCWRVAVMGVSRADVAGLERFE